MKRSTRATSSAGGGEDGKSGGSSKKSKNRGSGFDTRFRFKIEPPPPKFPFCNEFFPLKIYLVDPDGVLQAGHEVPIAIELFVEGESTPVSVAQGGSAVTKKPLIMVDPKTPAVVSMEGSAIINVKVCELSMNRNNRKFCFVVKRAPGPRPVSLPCDINPTMTRAMLVVNSRIVITNSLPEIWYKDTGGRDKSIDINLELHGPGGIQTGMEVPVRCVLLYEDFKEVLNQEVLVPLPTVPMKIDGTGRSTIKVRIEDVSKNHQSKNFRIRVEPDTTASPIHYDKSPDISTPILIRSKLNKRQKEKLQKQMKEASQFAFDLKGPMASLKDMARSAENGGGAASSAALGSAPNMPNMQKLAELSSHSPEIATALWCQNARDLMAQFHLITGAMVKAYDAQITRHIESALSKSGNYEALARHAAAAAAATSSSTSSSSSGFPSASGLQSDNLPQGSLGSDKPIASARSTSISLFPSVSALNDYGESQGPPPPMAISPSQANLPDILRSTTELLRGFSSVGGGPGHQASIGGGGQIYEGFPSMGDFKRDFSVLSLPGEAPTELNLGARSHSLAFTSNEQQQSADNVEFIFAKIFSIGNHPIGLASFDKDKKLVGYFAKGGDFGGEDIVYKSVEQALAYSTKQKQHVDQCEAALEKHLEQNSKAVLIITSSEDAYKQAGGVLRKHKQS